MTDALSNSNYPDPDPTGQFQNVDAYENQRPSINQASTSGPYNTNTTGILPQQNLSQDEFLAQFGMSPAPGNNHMPLHQSMGIPNNNIPGHQNNFNTGFRAVPGSTQRFQLSNTGTTMPAIKPSLLSGNQYSGGYSSNPLQQQYHYGAGVPSSSSSGAVLIDPRLQQYQQQDHQPQQSQPQANLALANQAQIYQPQSQHQLSNEQQSRAQQHGQQQQSLSELGQQLSFGPQSDQGEAHGIHPLTLPDLLRPGPQQVSVIQRLTIIEIVGKCSQILCHKNSPGCKSRIGPSDNKVKSASLLTSIIVKVFRLVNECQAQPNGARDFKVGENLNFGTLKDLKDLEAQVTTGLLNWLTRPTLQWDEQKARDIQY